MSGHADGDGSYMPLRLHRIRALLESALHLPPDQREAHVRAACASDEGMVKEVLELLRQYGKVLERPERIGPYRVLEEIGRGSYGVVYKAERLEPVPMVVAIKVLHTGIASRDVLSRFEMERRVLAAMQHRCIARVHDAGATEQGLPYVVMELVEGLPVDQYCERHRLSVDERLRLFQQVCEGVQHAHLKGVVHRDLKPGNVLVVREGERHVPKIVDFGLAKALHRDAFGVEHHTGRDIAVGTLEYMSPEQAAGAREAIDARSDVYSLGVMLYQLLCDELPFPSKRLREAAESEARRIVQEEEPPRPSARLRSRPDSGTVAAQRQSTSGALQRTLETDLDWVVLKALAKEPERRYDAATTLAADLERYLNHEPVVAGPPSTSYRLKKLARRYRVQIAAASAVVLTAVTGAAVAVGYALAAQRERERALANAAAADAVTEFVQNALINSDPNQGGVQDYRVVDAMDKAVELLESRETGMEPAIKARLLQTITEILNGNGRSEKALELAEKALQIQKSLHVGDHEEIAGATSLVAGCLESLGRSEEALHLHQSVHDMFRLLHAGDHQDVASSLNNLAACHQSLGRPIEALALHEKALAMRQRLYPGTHSHVALSLHHLASVLSDLGRIPDALVYAESCLQMNQVLHQGAHPDVAGSLSTVGKLLEQQGRYEEAIVRFHESWQMYQGIFKGNHPDVAMAEHNLAYALEGIERYEEALRHYHSALSMFEQVHPDGHPESGIMLFNIGRCLHRAGRGEDALVRLQESLHMRQRFFSGDHPALVESLHGIAGCLIKLGMLADAREYARRARAMALQALPDGHELRNRVLNRADQLNASTSTPATDK